MQIDRPPHGAGLPEPAEGARAESRPRGLLLAPAPSNPRTSGRRILGLASAAAIAVAGCLAGGSPAPTPSAAPSTVVSPSASSSASRTDPAVMSGATTIAVIGDFGTGDANEGAVASMVAGWSPAAIVTTGDDYYSMAGGSSGAEKGDRSIGRYYCAWLGNAQAGTSCNGNPGATNRFFPSTGNHDYSDWGPDGGLGGYVAYFSLPGNERYYTSSHGALDLFILDTGLIEGSTVEADAQRTWLQSALATSTAKWKAVVFHHPPYSSGTTHGSSTWMRWPFREWGADVVINGHEHDYERVMVDGFPYIVNGLGGGSRYSFGTPIAGSAARYSASWGAMRVTATSTSLQLAFLSIDNGGTVRDELTLTKAGG